MSSATDRRSRLPRTRRRTAVRRIAVWSSGCSRNGHSGPLIEQSGTKTCQLGGKLSFPPPSEAGAFSASATRQGRNQRGRNRGETGSWICFNGSGKTAAHREQGRQGGAREGPSARVDSRRGKGSGTQGWLGEPSPS